ncbi:hypothetical protein AAHA92_08445 [Salvia divinorum]|uniref:Uncharacterized protein n=1 Tax=Salvia divinorum TaxID=28513 RepID=A0ABD1HQY4_SALDI
MGVKAGINNMMLFIKPFPLPGVRCMSSLAKGKSGAEEGLRTGWWLPDPRTGIYFPMGQERVMDDIPSGAASFDCTFWLRAIDGVDVDHHHHQQDLSSYNNISSKLN